MMDDIISVTKKHCNTTYFTTIVSDHTVMSHKQIFTDKRPPASQQQAVNAIFVAMIILPSLVLVTK